MELALKIVALVLVIVWFVYKKLTAKFDVLAERGVKYEKSAEVFLNIFKMLSGKKSIFDFQNELYKKFPNEKVVGIFSFGSPNFFVRDVDVVKQITIKDFDSFVNHDKTFDESTDKIAGIGLLSMYDEKWRSMRNSLSPIFTSSKMKMMFETLSECAQGFVTHFEKKMNKGKVIINAKDVFARYTVDGISTAALGFKGDCVENEDSEIFKIAKSITAPTFSSMIKMSLLILAKPLYVLLGLQLISQEVRDFFHRVIIDSMDEREKNGTFRADIIQLLLQVKKGKLVTQEKNDEKDLKNFSANIEYDAKPKDQKLNWTKEDFMAQGFTFFSAGFDTTRNLLQTLSYELAVNQQVQKKLIEEVDDVLSNLEGKSVTYEALHKMKFLDQVISESLRFWSPAFGTNRVCNKDCTVDMGNGRTLHFKSGDQILIPIASIHRDEKYFENPNTFDPHRFDDDKKSSIVPGSYLPFGYGPRACIGSRFALMEAKILIFNILSKFTIEVCEKTPKFLQLAGQVGTFEFKEEIFVELKPRK